MAEAEQRPEDPLPVSGKDHRHSPLAVLHVSGPRELRLRGDGGANNRRESRLLKILQLARVGEGFLATPSVPYMFQSGRRPRGDDCRHGAGRTGRVLKTLHSDGDKRERFPDNVSCRDAIIFDRIV